jgi:Bacterial PH domain
MQIAEQIRSELGPGEQVLWSGQPRHGVILRGSDALMIPFSLLWAGFSVFWLVSAAQSGAPLPFVLFGVPFVLVGVYIVIGRFFVEAKQRQSTYYAVTPQRIIIASGLFSRKIKSLNLRAISEISISERGDGTGTITFGPQHPMASMFGGMSSWPGAEQYLGPRFDLIAQARSVYESVRKAQANAE